MSSDILSVVSPAGVERDQKARDQDGPDDQYVPALFSFLVAHRVPYSRLICPCIRPHSDAMPSHPGCHVGADISANGLRDLSGMLDGKTKGRRETWTDRLNYA